MLRMGVAHLPYTKDGCSPSAISPEGAIYITDGCSPSTTTMGQSLVKNYVHIVFSTKYREPLIHPPVEAELHAYLGGICNRLGCHVIKVGGYTDHIHILCMLSRKIALMKLMEELKSHSSKWIKSKGKGYENFYWQFSFPFPIFVL